MPFSGCKHLLTADSRFKWIILPEALRSILTRLLSEGMDDQDDSDEDSVAQRWLDFAASLHPEPPPPADGRDADIIATWVDDVVVGFCRRHRALGHWRAAVHPNDDLFSSPPT